MKISRRKLLIGGAVASTVTAVPAIAAARSNRTITVFDSRLEQSRLFAISRMGQAIDVAQNPHNVWYKLRDIPTGSSIAGLTCWSDFIAIRGHLEYTGMRVKFFEQVGNLNNWVIE